MLNLPKQTKRFLAILLMGSLVLSGLGTASYSLAFEEATPFAANQVSTASANLDEASESAILDLLPSATPTSASMSTAAATPSSTAILIETPTASPSATLRPTLPVKPKITKPSLLKKGFQAREEVEIVLGDYQAQELKIRVVDKNGVELPIETKREEGVLKISSPRSFRPGKYTVKVIEREEVVLEQDFSWGVLAINTNKSIYLPGEKARLAMAVLDEEGRMVCEAKLRLEIRNPKSEILNGSTRASAELSRMPSPSRAESRDKFQIQNSKFQTILSTEEETIRINPECQFHGFTLKPDYEAEYQVGEVGVYELELTAETKNGSYTITDTFSVRESVPFDIERDTATRIYPPEKYPVTFYVVANQDFEGVVEETVPASFEIRNPKSEILNGSTRASAELSRMPSPSRAESRDKFQIQNSNNQSEKQIVWQVDWKAGENYELLYEFDAPDVSPQFYLLGPLRFVANAPLSGQAFNVQNASESGEVEATESAKNFAAEVEELPRLSGARDTSEVFGEARPASDIIFREARQWQIAADASPTEYTTPGSGQFTAEVTGNHTIALVGGGGGGAGGGAGVNKRGGGGGGGSGNCVKVVFLTQGQNYDYSVGTAGSGSASGINGSDGGNTTFTVGGTTYTANGGGGGKAPTTYTGGTGGGASNCDTNYTGGAGGTGTAAAGSGGGGSAAGTTGNGNDGSVPGGGLAKSLYGGAGGAGTTANSSGGTAATDPYGGGGGGGTRNGSGGNGNSGYIRIEWEIPTITVSGTVRDTNESDALTAASGTTVTIISEGQSAVTTTVQSDGTYTKSGVIVGAAGNALVVYLDDSGSYKGSVATLANDTISNIENLDIYKDRVIADSRKTGTSITNSDFGDVDQSDTDDLFSVSGGVLTISQGYEFHIMTGKTFAPGANVNFGGSYHNTGTASWSSYTATFNSSSTGQQIDSGGSSFNNVVFNNASGGWTAVTNTFTVGGTLTITAGSFDTGAVTNAVTGATDVTGTLTISSLTGTKTFTGDVTINSGGTWSETAAEDVSFEGSLTNNATTWTASTGTHYFTGTSKTISGSTTTEIPNVSVSGSVTNSGTMTVSASLAGAGSFTNGDGSSGTLNFGGSSIGVTTFTASAANNTVNYNSSAAGQTIRGVTYHNLSIDKSGQIATPDGAIVVNGDLTVAAGTLALGANSLTVGSTSVADSGSIKVAGIISQSSSATTTIKSSASGTASCIGANSADCTGTPGTIGFYNLTIGDSSTSFTTTIRGTGVAVSVGNTLTISTNATLSANGTLNVAGDWTREATSYFTANSSTVVLNGGLGTIQTISGTNTFYALEATTTSARTIKFPSSVTTTISSSLTLTGTTGPTYLTLAPSTTDTVWTIDPPPSSVSVDYVSVSYSTATECINATNSYNGGSNTLWAYSGGGCNQNPNSPSSLAQKKTDDTVLDTGDWTNETSVKFTATASDPDSSDTLYLCVEKDILGTGFSNTEDSCGSGVAYSGTPVTVAVTISSLTDAQEYHWQARVKDEASTYSSWQSYPDPTPNGENERDFGVDTTAPTGGTVYDGTESLVDQDFNDNSLSSLSANWSGFDAQVSSLNYYECSIGTTQGGTDVKAWTNNGVSTSVTVSSLTLQTSSVYYFNVRAIDNAGNTQSPVISSDGQVVSPSLDFSVSPSTLSFDNLNEGNSFTDTEQATLTTSTNAYGGYVVRSFTTDVLTSTIYPSETIIDYNGGTYAAPDQWLSSDRGFGYNSSDTTIQEVNKFNSDPCPGGGSPPCYAPFSQTGPGDIVADHTNNVTGSPITNEQFTIAYKVMTDQTQVAAPYVTTVVYTATASY